jgi:hypothetical protein
LELNPLHKGGIKGVQESGNDNPDGFRIPTIEIYREQIRPVTEPVHRGFDPLA